MGKLSEMQQSEINDLLMKWISTIEDPELRMSLVDLGLIYLLEYSEGKVTAQMTLTTPACPVADSIVKQVKDRLEEHEEIKSADVVLVWDPKWDPKTMASDEAKETMGIW